MKILPKLIIPSILMAILEYSQTAAVMTLFQIQESYQAAMMAAFTMDVSGQKKYIPYMLEELEKGVFDPLDIIAFEQMKVAPYASYAFDVFFYCARLALEAYTSD